MMMKNRGWMLSCFLMSALLVSCSGSKAPAPDDGQPLSDAALEHTRPAVINYNAPEHKEALETVRRVADYAPRITDRVQVTSVSDNMSARDAQRSYLYGKPEIRLCYTNAYVGNNALVLDSNVRISLDGGGKVTAVVFEPAIEDQDFARCMDDAVKKFRFPRPRDEKPATIDLSMTLTSRPAMTAEEIRGLAGDTPEDEDDHHDHHHHH